MTQFGDVRLTGGGQVYTLAVIRRWFAVRVSTCIATVLQMGLVLASSLQAQDSVTLSVSANMDIYRAGGYNDGSDGIAPVPYTLGAGTGRRTVTFPSVGGAWTCTASVPEYGADGTGLSTGCKPPGGANISNPIGTFSGYESTDFSGAMVGMFLENALPASAPPALRFYVSDSAQGGIQTDFRTLNPRIGQVFFIGDGLTGTGSGVVQVFEVSVTWTLVTAIWCRLAIPTMWECSAPWFRFMIIS